MAKMTSKVYYFFNFIKQKMLNDDKVAQIVIEGLKLLKTWLVPPVCGSDVEPNFIQKSIIFCVPVILISLNNTKKTII